MAEVIKNVAESLDENLEILQPEENFVLINGEQVYVKQFTFGKLLKALKYLSNLADILQEGEDGLQQNLLQAFARHGDDIIGLLSLCTGKPKEFFDELEADKGLDMAVLAYKVNENFFVNNLFPKLNQMFPSDLQNQSEETEIVETETKAKAKKLGSTSSKN